MVAKFILTGSPKFWKSAAACAIILISTARAARAQTFSSANISNNVASSASYPDLVVDAVGNVNVAWVDSVSGIQFSRSTNAGQSFLPAVAIGGSIGAAFQPQMILDSTATIVEIAWAKPSTAAGAPAGTFDVFVSRSVNGGLAFLPTDTTQVSTAPVVLVDSPRLAFDGARSTRLPSMPGILRPL